MKIYLHGRGDLSAAGCSAASVLDTYLRGRKTWRVDEATGLPVYAVAGLPDDPAIAEFAKARRADRSTLLALHAAQRAVAQAGWGGKEFSVILGSSRGPTQRWEEGYDTFLHSGSVPTRTSPNTTLGSPAFALADFFGVSAMATGLSVTCSSGFHALIQGVALLRAGMAERVLVGGAEAPLTTFTLRQMEALRIAAPIPDAVEPACRPFSTPASGMALGEGAAFFALSLDPSSFAIEGLSFAREAAGSATGITASATALQQTMRDAIAQGGWPDFIVAHAPGTKRGDIAEAKAVNTICKDIPENPVMTSFKWATGHTFGASGPLALCAALDVLENGQWAPLPYGGPRETPWSLGAAIVNATGFGGNAVSVLVRQQVS